MIERNKIQAFVDEVVRQFQPERVVLFGSYAYGQPTEDSDVDLLVIMDTRDTRSTRRPRFANRSVPAFHWICSCAARR